MAVVWYVHDSGGEDICTKFHTTIDILIPILHFTMNMYTKRKVEKK